MKYWHYLADGDLLRIKAARRPSKVSIPKRGTWVVYEYREGKWEMPCFPEINWKTLSSYEFLGGVEEEMK